jgi:hypothetical protein
VWCRVRSGQVPSLVAETILSAGRHRARPPRGAASAIRPARGHDPLSAGRRAAGLAETNRWAGDVLDGAVRDVAALRDLGARCAVGGANLRKSGKIGDGQHDVPVSSMRAPAGRGGAPSSSGRRRPTATGRGPDAGGARGHTGVVDADTAGAHRDGLCRPAQLRTALWVPQTLHTSRDLLILVEQPTEPVVPSDLVDLGCSPMGEWSLGGGLAEGSVRPVTVVMLLVLAKHGCGVTLVDD